MSSGSPQSGRSVLTRGLAVLGVAIREEPRVFAVAVLASALYGFMTVAAAWVIGAVTDAVVVPAFRTGRADAGALAAALLAITAVGTLKAAGIVGRRLFAGIMQYRLQATYRRRVTRQYLRLPLAWHHKHPTGQLLSNANADVEATWYPIAPLPMATGVLVMLLVAAVSMVVTDLVLAGVGFLVFPAILLINVFYQRRLAPRATRAQQLRAEVSEVAHESFDGGLVIKTLGREAEETARFRERAERLRDANIAVGRIRGMFDPLLDALPNLGILLVLLVGTVRIQSGALGAGELVRVAYLFTLIAFPIRAIGWVLGDLARSVVGWERVTRVLTATGALPYGERSLDGGDKPLRLDVQDVRFRYEPGADVLRDVTFEVTPGRTVAVVGPTGSGKSTLTTLLVRLVDPDSGAVLADGVDLREVRRGGIPEVAAVVPQQTFLFDDTVRGNVTLGLDLPDEAVWEALRLAQADEFVRKLPDGLDTRVGERGMSLSGGQRQRLALARALVRKPRLLILDDATSSVDPTVEARILRGLRDADLPATVVVIAYRKATIALADEVVFIEHGQVSARGTHAELLDRSPGYRNLITAYERAQAERQALET
ncbi:ABC transporter related protein [Carbonactinospora thermoautotrophica]|uniref:ABC transporter related protein n=1 Tax=Carbonactinospora thermoautotrophica TaxID=1469144 RepID=A0A132MPQ1_9ACTN|nr:ABC transporter ATP-binding protein [Carbonactinospora thermoautotrophica]KWW99844.1 ABC transporter related protein [Carbonactinospora thermoautotrophica]